MYRIFVLKARFCNELRPITRSKNGLNSACQGLAFSRHVRHASIKIQVMSDLHLELCKKNYLDFSIPRKAPYLLLAGDIGLFTQLDKYLQFLRHQCSLFSHVYLILGNHEFYGLSRRGVFNRVSELLDDPELRGSLSVLDRGRVDLSRTVTLLGCTLHSHIPREAHNAVKERVGDFRRIKNWKIGDHNREHFTDVTWLRTEIESISTEEPRRCIIIATHHAPSRKGTTHPKHRGKAGISAFCTDLLESQVQSWQGIENVKYWVFGHTHMSTEFDSETIRVVANQRGYVHPTRHKSRRTVPRLFELPKGAVRFDKQKCIVINEGVQ